MFLAIDIGNTSINMGIFEGDGTLTGTAMGIDDEGRLLLRLPNRRLKKITSGDLVLVR